MNLSGSSLLRTRLQAVVADSAAAGQPGSGRRAAAIASRARKLAAGAAGSGGSSARGESARGAASNPGAADAAMRSSSRSPRSSHFTWNCRTRISRFRPIQPSDAPPLDLTNSPRLQNLIRDGKLYISLHDAIALAIENNLDLAYFRYNFPIAQTDYARTKAGGTANGVNTGNRAVVHPGWLRRRERRRRGRQFRIGLLPARAASCTSTLGAGTRSPPSIPS